MKGERLCVATVRSTENWLFLTGSQTELRPRLVLPVSSREIDKLRPTGRKFASLMRLCSNEPNNSARAWSAKFIVPRKILKTDGKVAFVILAALSRPSATNLWIISARKEEEERRKERKERKKGNHNFV